MERGEISLSQVYQLLLSRVIDVKYGCVTFTFIEVCDSVVPIRFFSKLCTQLRETVQKAVKKI